MVFCASIPKVPASAGLVGIKNAPPLASLQENTPEAMPGSSGFIRYNGINRTQSFAQRRVATCWYSVGNLEKRFKSEKTLASRSLTLIGAKSAWELRPPATCRSFGRNCCHWELRRPGTSRPLCSFTNRLPATASTQIISNGSPSSEGGPLCFLPHDTLATNSV